MKNHKEKVVAAIAGAITMYLQAKIPVEVPREEPVQMYTPARPIVTPSLWAISGRQAAMEMRRMLQMRLFR
jgi:hypothetical protein